MSDIGLPGANPEVPDTISVTNDRRTLRVGYSLGRVEVFPAEILRVLSPSAEVRGHGPQTPPPVAAKRDVAISRLDAVGNYAVRITFSDGHDTGLFSWAYLAELAEHRERLWNGYLDALAAAGLAREG